MAVLEVNSHRPKAKKGASKKNKKSWRKNTDLEEVEDFLEDQRLEERLGGAFDKRSNSELFVVDGSRNKSTISASGSNPALLSKREARKKKAREKALKCFSNLEVEKNSSVQDPKKGRDSRKPPEQRKNPTVRRKEEELAKAGIIRHKVATAIRQRQNQEERKKSTLLDRTTRRRTEFGFDLWNTNITPEGITQTDQENGEEIDKNDWLENQTKQHNLNNTRRMKRKAPTDYYAKQSALSAVEVPHGGASYNPSYKEHQDLLWKAAMDELTKEKRQRKIEYHTTNMFPKAGDAPTEKTWISEMSEGINSLQTGENKSENEEDDGSEMEDDQTKINKPKTKKQRRKEQKLRMAERKAKTSKKEKMSLQDVYRMKSINKEIIASEKLISQRMAKRAEQKELKKSLPLNLTGYKFEEQEKDIKLSEELTGNLLSLKPEGNLLTDRFKSMQKRNIIETRVKQKIVKNRRKRKLAEKRSYKMGFAWEKK